MFRCCVQNSSRSREATDKSERGFTLVELLVVIGIIALLISILLPSLNKAQRAAKLIACSSNMRTVGQYIFMYANDYKGSLPPIYQGLQNGTNNLPNFNQPWLGNNGMDVPGSTPGSAGTYNGVASQFAPGTMELWAILETYYKLAPNSLACVCPQVYADRGAPALSSNGTNAKLQGAFPNAIYSYQYSFLLGGMQIPGVGGGFSPYAPTGQGPIEVNISGTEWWFARPWRLGAIANPTGCAVLVEDKTTYWKPSYNWKELESSFNLNFQSNQTIAPYFGHQEFIGVNVAHNPVYSNGSNPDGTPCSGGQGNVLFADGHVSTQVVHQGTVGVSAAAKNGLGWIDGVAADPNYAP